MGAVPGAVATLQPQLGISPCVVLLGPLAAMWSLSAVDVSMRVCIVILRAGFKGQAVDPGRRRESWRDHRCAGD